MNIRLTTIIFFFLLMSSYQGFSQDQKIDDRNPRAMMKASFLFQFAKQSNWTSSKKGEKFIIAVYNNHDIFTHLTKKYATQPIGNQTLNIIEVTSIDNLGEADIIFIDQSSMADFEKITKHFSKKNTLIVTESTGALGEGSIINFLVIESVLKIEINNQEARKKKINIGKLLLNWSINN